MKLLNCWNRHPIRLATLTLAIVLYFYSPYILSSIENSLTFVISQRQRPCVISNRNCIRNVPGESSVFGSLNIGRQERKEENAEIFEASLR